MNTEIRLTVAGLIYNQTVAGTYGLVLSEVDGNRRFSVMIGEPEAQSIAMKMNNKKSPRPLTHDLINTLLTVFGARLEKVLIYDMVNDVFYAELHLKKGDALMVVDARTSDAIAIAVRSESPIFIREEVLSIVGTELDSIQVTEEEEETPIENKENKPLTMEELIQLPSTKLDEMLNEALAEEEYEWAVKLRDALKRKKNT